MPIWPMKEEYYKYFLKWKFITTYKMGKEIVTFSNIEVEKQKFYATKAQFKYMM